MDETPLIEHDSLFIAWAIESRKIGTRWHRQVFSTAGSFRGFPNVREHASPAGDSRPLVAGGAAFQHDLYTLKADRVLIFALVDDYSKNVELEHTIPEGFAIEFPLSKQDEKATKIKGLPSAEFSVLA